MGGMVTEVPYVLVICAASVICLTPLAVYLRIVAALGQRGRPTIVSGAWDFAGLLAGLSGFLLFGGVLFMSLMQSHFRIGLRGGFAVLRSAWEHQATTWSVLVGLYGLAMGIWVSLVVLSRWRTWVIYNVEPRAVEELLRSILTELGVPVHRQGNRWYRANDAVFEIEGIERGNSATIRWLYPDRTMYEEVDRLLRSRSFKLPVPHENRTSLWLRTAASGLGVFSLTCLGMLTYALFWSR